MRKTRFFIVSQNGCTTKEELLTARNHVAQEVVRIFGEDIELMYCTLPQEDWTVRDLCEVIVDMAEADVVYFCQDCDCNKNVKILRDLAQEYHLYILDGIFEK